ncbi:IGF-like family receptor 1 [Cyprinus carpio]|uniref:IGF-like family receptor 1 n=1 Tax=Cyprinus carpio TaxID=7962 RepID=A0A9R0AF70_CYPCA|nr:IGF-like family receptor 1 [Cyprinus carpio]XP_042595856.1 IGF-like family receptor 1 [Cyprinus carpio]
MTSQRCVEGTFFNRSLHKCQQCETKYEIQKGHYFTENCGWSDEQQQVESPYRPCIDGTFNDGSQVVCRTCSSCQPQHFIASACNTTSDTICCKQGEQFFNGKCLPQPTQTTRTTTASTTVHTSSVDSSSPSPTSSNFPDPSQSTENSISSPQSLMPFIGIYVCFGILSTLTLVCLFLFIRRRSKPFNEELKKCCNGASHESLSRKGIARYEQAVSYNIINDCNNDHMPGLSHLLATEVHDAPLKTVLNNLDVLEELVLVLDPDISGAKNTRHLAAQCSFSFAWINYAYSMKDHKSPLVAVLEGVVTKNPDWTVGHLAELLTTIGRNDAVEILAKLPADV